MNENLPPGCTVDDIDGPYMTCVSCGHRFLSDEETEDICNKCKYEEDKED